MEQSEKFEGWGIVEVMGHKKFAGRIGEQIIAGAALVRVDVPETQQTGQVPGYGGTVVRSTAPYTKLIGVGSIYCITPTDEETARRAAVVIERYNDPLPVTLPKLLPAGAARADVEDAVLTSADDQADDDDDDFPEVVWDRIDGER
jgi:hypothetical protein